jgi:hypothetical protein
MTITPAELLDTSIAQLQTLAAFLADQLSDASAEDGTSPAATETRVCREVLDALGALIYKLHATRPGTALSTCPDLVDAEVERRGTTHELSVRSARAGPRPLAPRTS